jgi:hypothetical protein
MKYRIVLALPFLLGMLHPLPDSPHRQTQEYRLRKRLSMKLWALMAVPAVLFPFPPLWLTLVLLGSLGSFVLLDEAGY